MLHAAIAAYNVKIKQFFQPQNIYQKLAVLNLLFLLITFFIGSPFPQLNRYFSFSLLTQTSSSPLSARPAGGPAGPLRRPPRTDQVETGIEASRQIPPGPALETGGTESGEIRKVVWKGALDIARHFPLFGSGVETFAFSYYRFKPKEHNLTSEWDFLYNKAHNEYLNYAATTGFLGLGAYLFLIGSFIWWNIQSLIYANSIQINTNKRIISNSRKFARIRVNSCKEDTKTITPPILMIALLSSYASILVTNFFGFSVVVTSLFFWLIPAISFLFSNSLNPQSSLKISLPTMKQFNNVAIPTVFFVICYLLFVICKLWYADTLFAHGNTLVQANEHITAYPYLQKAVNLRPSEPLYHDKLSINMINLATIAFLENEASLSAALIDQALTHSQKAITISPQNLTFWKTRTRLFYFLSQIEEGYNQEALASLLVAKTLAPTDVKIAYNLALLYAEIDDTNQAIKTLKETIDLKPNYRDAHFALALFYKKEGLDQKAISELKYILEKINPSDEEIKEQLEEWSQ